MTALDDLAAIVVSEVDALIEDAGDRREPGTVRVLETLRAAVRYLEQTGPPQDHYAIRFAGSPPPTSAEWNALVEDHRRLRRELHDVTAAAAELKPARPVVETLPDAVRLVDDVLDERGAHPRTSGTADAIVALLVADPIVIARRNDAGAFDIETRWPDDAVACLISRRLLDEIVVELNASRTLVTRIRATLDGAP